MGSVVYPFQASASGPASTDPAEHSAQLMCAVSAEDVAIKTLGKCLLPSPVAEHLGDTAMHFVGRADKVLVDDCVSQIDPASLAADRVVALELAGPRNKIFFDPRDVRCGIVTCGGLCPGLNNVIRGLVLELSRGYGVRNILGFRYGYEGILSRIPLGQMGSGEDIGAACVYLASKEAGYVTGQTLHVNGGMAML